MTDTAELVKLAAKLDDADFLVVRNCPMVTKFDHENVDEMLSGDQHNAIVAALRLAAQQDGVRTDLENAPSPCLGWCIFGLGEGEWRMIWRTREGSTWSAHGCTQDVRAWQPMPAPPRL